MPVLTHFPIPKSASGGIENVTKQTIGTGASGAEIALGPRQYFLISAFAATTPTGLSNINVKFGAAGLSAAANTDLGLPVSGPGFSVAPVILGTGEEFSSIRIFNNTSASVDVYVSLLNIAG